MARLAGRVAVITGAGRGIGLATAELFAREGAALALVDRDGDAAATAAAALRRVASAVAAYVVDVVEMGAADRIVAEIQRDLGAVAVLINNAAISHSTPALETTDEQWRAVLRVDLDAVFSWSRAAARAMVEGGRGGRIVNMASVNGWLGLAGSAPYNAAKGGVLQLTRALAVELAPHGIVVNAIAPGFIKAGLSIGPDGVDETETAWFKERYIAERRIPLARAGLPEDVAAAALFLASDDCRYMTGATLVVDGGLTITF